MIDLKGSGVQHYGLAHLDVLSRKSYEMRGEAVMSRIRTRDVLLGFKPTTSHYESYVFLLFQPPLSAGISDVATNETERQIQSHDRGCIGPLVNEH
jgi:hypothetical protein